jgi:hypothetical protein
MPLTWHTLFHTTDGIAAFGTIALAVVTGFLALGTLLTARRTKETATETHGLAEATNRLAELTAKEVQAVADQADAARQEVELSRQALQANIKPRLLNVPWSNAGETHVRFENPRLPSTTHPPPPDLTSTTVHVPLRNVGPGLAFIQEVTMYWNEVGSNVNPVSYIGTTTAKVVPTDEMMVARFLFGDELNSSRALRIAEQARAFWVEVSYTDAVGLQMERVRLTFGLDADAAWVVTEVGYFQVDEREPYVSSAVH